MPCCISSSPSAGVVALYKLVAKVALGLVLTAFPVAGEEAIQRLARLGEVLQQQPVWQAEYEQEYLPAGMTEGEQASGTVWVSWPDRALFKTGEPVLRLMGVKGRSVRLLDFEVATCDDHQLNDQEWARIPLAAVLDPQGAAEHFTVLALASGGIALIPREPGGVARVQVELGPDGMPTEVVVSDPQTATNRLSFSGWQRAEAPLNGRWLPAPPPEIACISD